MAKSAYAKRRLAEIRSDGEPVFTQWWFSGQYWYCHAELDGRKVTGAGRTKLDAKCDGVKQLRKTPC